MRRNALTAREGLGFLVACALLGGASGECQGPAARLSIDPFTVSTTVPAGETATLTFTVKTKSNINSQVVFSIVDFPAGLPVGWTAEWNPAVLASTAQTSTLTIHTAADAADGEYQLTGFANESDGISLSTSEFAREKLFVTVKIQGGSGAPDFTLAVSRAEYDFGTGNSAPPIECTLAPHNGFSGSVAVALTGVSAPLGFLQGLPGNVTIDPGKAETVSFRLFRSSQVTFDKTVTLTASSSSLIHETTIRFRGTGTGGCCTAPIAGHSLCFAGKTEAECASDGGTYRGDGSACAEGACSTPGHGGDGQGACCLGGAGCQQLLHSVCTEQGGVFLGTGTSCSPSSGCP